MNDLNLTVRNRQGVLFTGEVKAITSFNDKGVFDVLPEHENFISVIKKKVIIRKTKNEKQEIPLDNGVLKVYKNVVNIYLVSKTESLN